RAEGGDLAFGTVDTLLVWHLTGGRRHVTDATNASRTLLMDLAGGQWADDLCQFFDVPAAILPEIAPSAGVFGQTLGLGYLPDGLKAVGAAPEIDRLALEGDPESGVVFVPALTGLGAPYWEPEARGTIFGLTRATSVADLARATLEGVAFQVADLIAAIQADLP